MDKPPVEESVIPITALDAGEDLALDSVPLPDDSIVDVPPVPSFQEIYELIYLDDKVSKFGKKIKRPVERSVQ